MLQFLFDTDHLTLYQHKHPPLMQRLALQPPDAVAICPINIEETMRGRLAVLARVLTGPKHVQAYARLVAAEEMFRVFSLVPFDSGSESRFRQLRAARGHARFENRSHRLDERLDGVDPQSQRFWSRPRPDVG